MKITTKNNLIMKKIFLLALLMASFTTSVNAQYYTPGYYPAELALISEPMMSYRYNFVRLYYDVQNIGDVRYSGNFLIYLYPNNTYFFARDYIRVKPGEIKRIVLDIPIYQLDLSFNYTVLAYYEDGGQLSPLTTFEYYPPMTIWWRGPRTDYYIVNAPRNRPNIYNRPPDGPKFFYNNKPYGEPYCPIPQNPYNHGNNNYYNGNNNNFNPGNNNPGNNGNYTPQQPRNPNSGHSGNVSPNPGNNNNNNNIGTNRSENNGNSGNNNGSNVGTNRSGSTSGNNSGTNNTSTNSEKGSSNRSNSSTGKKN